MNEVQEDIVHMKKWDENLMRFHAVNMLPKYIYLFASLFSLSFLREGCF